MSERARVALWLSLTVVLFIGVGLLAQTGAEFDFTRDHASTRSNPWGTKAWRELLEHSGLQSETWLEPLTQLTDDVRCLVLLDPTLPVSGEERDALVDWVEAGGRLVVAPHAHRESGSYAGRVAQGSMEDLLAAFGLRAFGGNPAEWEIARAVEEPLTADVERVHVPTDYRLDAFHAAMAVDEQSVLFGSAQAAAAVRVELGEGTVVALCEAGMLGNATLREADNVVLAANLIFADGAPETVYFDEYHHGLAERERALDGPQVDVAPVRNTALALLGIAALYALGRSRRFGSPIEDRETGVRAGDEYVRAFAQIYSGAKASGAAAGMLADGLRRRASRAAGVPAGTDETVLETALERRGLPGREIVELLKELDAADHESPGERELLALAQRVAQYERML